MTSRLDEEVVAEDGDLRSVASRSALLSSRPSPPITPGAARPPSSSGATKSATRSTSAGVEEGRVHLAAALDEHRPHLEREEPAPAGRSTSTRPSRSRASQHGGAGGLAARPPARAAGAAAPTAISARAGVAGADHARVGRQPGVRVEHDAIAARAATAARRRTVRAGIVAQRRS